MHIPITLLGKRAGNLQLPPASMVRRLFHIENTKGTVTAMNRQLVEQLVPPFSISFRRFSSCHGAPCPPLEFPSICWFSRWLIIYAPNQSVAERVRRETHAAGFFHLASVCATLPNVLPPCLWWQQFQLCENEGNFHAGVHSVWMTRKQRHFFKRSNTSSTSFSSGLAETGFY